MESFDDFGGFRGRLGHLACPDVPHEPQPKTLAARLAVAISASGLRDQEVAERAGVDPNWLASVKSRTRPIKNPDPHKLYAVAKVVNVSLQWLADDLGWYVERESAATTDQIRYAKQAVLESNWSERNKETAIAVLDALEASEERERSG